MMYAEFGITTGDGLKLFGRRWEPQIKSRGVICLIHGLGEHSGRYEHLAQALTHNNYALLAVDLRGHGRSEGKRGHISKYDALLDDIGMLIAKAHELYAGVPVYLYGHSLGGNLVLNYALRRKHDLAGLVVTSPWLRLAFDPPAVQVRMAKAINVFWPSFTQKSGLQVQYLCRDAEVVKAYQQDPLVHSRISVRLFAGAYAAGLWALQHGADLTIPLLLMHGSADQITSAKASSDFAQNVSAECTLKIWPGLFHETHNEPQQSQVLEFICNWLRNQHSKTAVK